MPEFVPQGPASRTALMYSGAWNLVICAYCYLSGLEKSILFESFTGITPIFLPFAVAPASVNWAQAMFDGSPAPSMLDGPANSPRPGTLQITDGLGRFTFAGFYFSSNNGDSSYDIQAFVGATLVYHEAGSLSGSF